MKVMLYLKPILLLFLGLLLTACKPSSPEEKAGVNSNGILNDTFTLSQSEFDALSADDQFVVANKALSTMYRGLPMDEFFNVPQGLANPEVKYSLFIEDLQRKLNTTLSSAEVKQAKALTFGQNDDVNTISVDESIPAMFISSDSESHPHQVTMAKAQSYPISKNQFTHWMSYFLANTIMFSPAREMESTDAQDIGRVLSYLELSIAADTPIRDTIRGWLNNLSRWRVSRSAENHALEMFELYLGIFNDTEEEQQNTINGGKACSAWLLTDNNADYQLKKDPFVEEGIESVKVFDNYISSCAELYDLVAGHPLVIPRVTEVIVNYFLDGSTAEAKQLLIQNIVNTGPVTFQDIFLPIIFSEEFLLNSERPKTFEENAFGFLHSMHWTPRSNSGNLDDRILDVMLDSTSNNNNMAVHNMGWAAMDSKIGRTPFLPMDSLSFATYHKAIRESVLLNNRAFDGRVHPKSKDYTEAAEPSEPPFTIKDGAFYIAGTENLKPELDGISVNDFIDLVFLSALGRRATSEETEGFKQEGTTRDYLRFYDEVLELRRSGGGDDEIYEYWVDDFAEIMLDYITRLPEFYYYRSVEG
jgi:hypothetical protein